MEGEGLVHERSFVLEVGELHRTQLLLWLVTQEIQLLLQVLNHRLVILHFVLVLIYSALGLLQQGELFQKLLVLLF